MSAEIPRGWRLVKDNERVKHGDAVFDRSDGKFEILDYDCNACHFRDGAAAGNSIDVMPYIRRIRRARKHRFDGMTLEEVWLKLRDHWELSPDEAYPTKWIIQRFVREVRRRDALRRARK